MVVGRLLVAVLAVFLLFNWVATRWQSDRGQAGIAVCAVVLVATGFAEWLIFRRRVRELAPRLGLTRPRARGVLVAGAVGVLLLLLFPVFALATGSSLAMYPGWAWLLPGLFAQAGIAEEVLFRGFLFGRVREPRSFWRAAVVASVPFTAVHLVLLWMFDWPIALAALLLAVVISFPQAHLYELGRRTIWGPAIVHFVVQGAIKVIVVDGPAAASFPLVWMAACGVIPFAAFMANRADEPNLESARAR